MHEHEMGLVEVKPLDLLVMLVVAGISFFAGAEYRDLHPSSRAVAVQPPTELSQTGRGASLEQQRICAEQAAKSFKEAAFQTKPNVVNSYENHYSARLGKCFILFHVLDVSGAANGVSTNYEGISDAFEGADYGNFFERTDSNGEIVSICDMTPPGTQKSNCRTKDEWESFKAAYMQR